MRIPYYSESEKAAPLLRCLQRSAQRMGMYEHSAALLMSFFFEEIANEVSKGRVIRIPGFGAFGAWVIENRAALARDPSRRCKPKFEPSRCFQQKVRWECPPDGVAKSRLQRYARNHSPSRRDRQQCDVVSSAEAFRQDIDRQMRDCGLDE